MIGEYAALVLLVAIGPGLLAAVPIYVIGRRRFLLRAVETSGTVTGSEWERSRGEAGPSTYRLTVRFPGPDGRELTFEEGGHRRDPPAGAPIAVMYDPARPERARVAFGPGRIHRTAAAMALLGAAGTAALALFLAFT